MKYYGCHWTSDDGTELQIRLDIESLELWARSCPKGGEWQSWRRLDVLRDGNGILLETAAKAVKADSAETAAKAALADLATRAQTADKATQAVSADDASHAANADNATRAQSADNANHAQTAETAKRLAQTVTISITGAVSGTGHLDGSGAVSIPTQAGDAFSELQSGIDRLNSTVNGLGGRLDGAEAGNGTLAQRMGALEKKIADMEAAASSGVTSLDTLGYRTNYLFSEVNRLSEDAAASNEGSGAIADPVWWGTHSYPSILSKQ